MAAELAAVELILILFGRMYVRSEKGTAQSRLRNRCIMWMPNYYLAKESFHKVMFARWNTKSLPPPSLPSFIPLSLSSLSPPPCLLPLSLPSLCLHPPRSLPPPWLSPFPFLPPLCLHPPPSFSFELLTPTPTLPMQGLLGIFFKVQAVALTEDLDFPVPPVAPGVGHLRLNPGNVTAAYDKAA